jgi:hypothetical protein
MQKAEVHNTCRIVRKFLAEQLIRSAWSVRRVLFQQPAKLHIDKTSGKSNFIIYTQEKLIRFRKCEAHFNMESFIVHTEVYMKEIILSWWASKCRIPGVSVPSKSTVHRPVNKFRTGYWTAEESENDTLLQKKRETTLQWVQNKCLRKSLLQDYSFCNWFSEIVRNGRVDQSGNLFHRWDYLNGHVNAQNNRYRSAKKSWTNIRHALHNIKLEYFMLSWKR